MRQHRVGVAVGLLGAMAAVVALAQDPQDKGEQERTVTADEVPKAALATLRGLAGKATITEFAEEIEHGHTFYEGSWTGPNGNVDALVTAQGDLVEIEESVPMASVPAAVRGEGEKKAGKGAELTFEKKTLVTYELHYTKDGKSHELVVTPDGRVTHEESGDGDEDG